MHSQTSTWRTTFWCGSNHRIVHVLTKGIVIECSVACRLFIVLVPLQLPLCWCIWAECSCTCILPRSGKGSSSKRRAYVHILCKEGSCLPRSVLNLPPTAPFHACTARNKISRFVSIVLIITIPSLLLSYTHTHTHTTTTHTHTQ